MLQTGTAPCGLRMHAPRLLLALALLASTLALAPTASAAEVVCDDGTCLVSVQTYVCVTTPCDGVVVCLAKSTVCSNRLTPW